MEIPRSQGSLLLGDLGTALLVMRVDPTPAIADLVYAHADANTTLPVRELMWGMPGSMVACWHMAAITAEPRWRALFAIQAARLLGDLEETTMVRCGRKTSMAAIGATSDRCMAMPAT